MPKSMICDFLMALFIGVMAWGEALPDAGVEAGSSSAAASPAQAAAASAPVPIQLGSVTITGTVRTRLYFWNSFQPAAGENRYRYSGDYVRLNFAQKHGSFDWDAEFNVPFLLGLPNNATDAAPQGALGLGSNYYTANKNNSFAAMFFPRQLFARFRGLGGNEAQTLQVGRFIFRTAANSPRKTRRLPSTSKTISPSG